MREDGYTLAEALAALLIVGLAIGGMVQGIIIQAEFFMAHKGNCEQIAKQQLIGCGHGGSHVKGAELVLEREGDERIAYLCQTGIRIGNHTDQ